MRSLAAVLVVVVAVLAVAGGAASARPRHAGPSKVDRPAGTHPEQIARFAVLMYSMNRDAKLKFISVSDSNQRPEMGGVRYQEAVTAADHTGAIARYLAVVWGIPGTYQWMLLEFKKIN